MLLLKFLQYRIFFLLDKRLCDRGRIFPLFEFFDAWAFLLIFMFPLAVGLLILFKMMPETKEKTMREILDSMGYKKFHFDPKIVEKF